MTAPESSPPPGGYAVPRALDGGGYHGMAVDIIRVIGVIGGECGDHERTELSHWTPP